MNLRLRFDTNMRLLPILFALSALCATAADHRALIRKSVEKYFQSVERQREYAFVRHTERREYDNSGQLRSHSNWTNRFDFVNGVRAGWTIERDGKPIPAGERLKTEEEVLRSVEEWKRKTPAEREKILAGRAKHARQESDYLREFPDALDFQPLPAQSLNGREMLVFAFTPRPGYKAKSREARVYEGVEGKIFIDKAELHVGRLEAEVVKDVSVGGFLAKIQKGTRFTLEQERIEPDRWMPAMHQIRFDVRVLLVKGIHRQVDSRFRDWRRHNGDIWRGD